jgi:hypothetical protein
MDLKKLLLSLAVSVPLVTSGCGDDGNGPPIVDPCEDIGENEELWELSGLALPTSAAEVIGFNLDEDDTTVASDEKTPENGCGIVDQAGGVDNALGVLLAPDGALGGVLSALGIDLQGEITSALANDKIVIQAKITNYTGVGSTGVTLSLYSNGEQVVNNVPATVDGSGNISATLSRLPITLNDLEIALDGMDPVSFDISLVIQNGRVEIPAPGSGASVTAVIGGGVVYTGSSADSFRSQLQNIIAVLPIEGIDITLLDGFILPQTDLATGEECDTLSIGAEATFSKVACN